MQLELKQNKQETKKNEEQRFANKLKEKVCFPTAIIDGTRIRTRENEAVGATEETTGICKTTKRADGRTKQTEQISEFDDRL